MAKEFSVIIEQDTEGYYVASVPALRGCHSQAKSLDELMVRIRVLVTGYPRPLSLPSPSANLPFFPRTSTPAPDAMPPTFFSKVNQPALVTGRRRRQGLRRRERAQSRASQHQGGTPRTS